MICIWFMVIMYEIECLCLYEMFEIAINSMVDWMNIWWLNVEIKWLNEHGLQSENDSKMEIGVGSNFGLFGSLTSFGPGHGPSFLVQKVVWHRNRPSPKVLKKTQGKQGFDNETRQEG